MVLFLALRFLRNRISILSAEHNFCLCVCVSILLSCLLCIVIIVVFVCGLVARVITSVAVCCAGLKKIRKSWTSQSKYFLLLLLILLQAYNLLRVLLKKNEMLV